MATKLAQGVPVEQIPRPELQMDELTPAQQRGLAIYNAACEPCHGGATTDRIVDREVHDFAIPELKPDGSGNVLFDTSVTPPVPVRANQPNNEFLNIGIANLSAFGQFGFPGIFTSNVPMPQYRFRFYTDATRTVVRADLPPVPVSSIRSRSCRCSTRTARRSSVRTSCRSSSRPTRGAPPSPATRTTSRRSTCPRCAASPTPRRTSTTTPPRRCEDLVDIYSRFIVQFFPMLNLPLREPARAAGSFVPESFTPAQKADLIAFLQIL